MNAMPAFASRLRVDGLEGPDLDRGLVQHLVDRRGGHLGVGERGLDACAHHGVLDDLGELRWHRRASLQIVVVDERGVDLAVAERLLGGGRIIEGNGGDLHAAPLPSGLEVRGIGDGGAP